MRCPAMFQIGFPPQFFLYGFLLSLSLVFNGCATAGRRMAGDINIPNFAQVDENLYRGAQPDAQGIEALERLGVKTVVNLRMGNDVWPKEAEKVCTAGIFYIQVPMSGFGRPTDQQISNVMAIIESSPRPVFVHCQFGRDRTGTVVACYRIARHNWTEQRALLEAKRYGLSRWEVGMKRCIRNFATSRRVAQTPTENQTLSPTVAATVPGG